MAITWTDDETSINTCQAKGDWTGTGFANPDDNTSGSTTPVYREGTGCMMATAASNTAGTWDDTIAVNLTDKALVWWVWLSGPTEIGYFTYFEIEMQDSAAYIRYDFWDEFTTLDIGGWFPCVCWPTDDGATYITSSGTVVISGVDGLAIRANNGQGTDVKLVAWDYIHSMGYMGAAGDTVTFEDFVLQDSANNFGVFTQKGSTFQAQCNVRYGGTGTTTVNESNKTMTFRGANSDHPVGFIFNSGGTATNITWSSMVFNWVFPRDAFTFTGTPNTFSFNGCVFVGAGDIELPAHSGSYTREVKGSTFDACQTIDVGDITFEDNTVSNSTDTGGAILMPTTASTSRVERTTITGNARGMTFTEYGSYTLDGDDFSGNTYDILNTETATVEDSYTSQNGNINMNTERGVGQTVTGAGGVLGSVAWKLSKTGSPTGVMFARLYAITGVHGTDGEPSGAPLSESNSQDLSALTATPTDIWFDFPNPYTMVNTTNYVITFHHPNGDGSNYVSIARDSSSPAHDGNYTEFDGTTWTYDTIYDMYFIIHSNSLVIANSINAVNVPSTFISTSTGRTVIQAAKDVSVHVIDSAGNDLEDVQVGMYRTSDDATLMSGLTDSNGEISTTFNFVSDTPVYIRARKSSLNIADSYPLSERVTRHNFSTTFRWEGQSFTGDGNPLVRIRVALRAVPTCTGDLTCQVFAHTGTYGTSSEPTGSALAVSEVVDSSVFDANWKMIHFDFYGDQQITLGNGTRYCFAVNKPGGTTALAIGLDDETPTHGGNYFRGTAAPAWTPVPASDVPFQVETEATPAITRYVAYSGVGTITTAGLAVTVTLLEDGTV